MCFYCYNNCFKHLLKIELTLREITGKVLKNRELCFYQPAFNKTIASIN